MKHLSLVAVLMTSVAVPVAAEAPAGQGQTFQVGSNDRRIACFKEYKEPAQYRIERHVVTPAQQYYFRRKSGVIELREKPPVYKEERILVQDERIVMREVKCPN